MVAATTPGPTTSTHLPGWMQKMVGSTAELGSYIGSGSFYSGGYSDPYVSASLYLRPTYDLGTRFKLSLTARLYFEEELTMPDVPTGRRWNIYDTWLTLGARNIHTFESSKVTLGGILRLIVPTSYESRWANLIVGMSVGPTLSRKFEFGSDPSPERRYTLMLTAIEQFSAYARTSETVGDNGTSGCHGPRGLGPGAVAIGSDGPGVAAADRCGGALTSAFGLRHAVIASLSRGKWDLGVTLLVDNAFKYRVPPDMFTSVNAVDRGQVDSTWGIVSVSYSLTDHFTANAGVSSFQPALDQQNHLRFPFFDLSGGANANNFTQAFVSLTGTL
ncbi:MAG TPA: hypothetical protein VHU40_12915 [Polyangia bacterium]|nr:hypothetical protein [Polyangia bacterium]